MKKENYASLASCGKWVLLPNQIKLNCKGNQREAEISEKIPRNKFKGNLEYMKEERSIITTLSSYICVYIYIYTNIYIYTFYYHIYFWIINQLE